MKFNVKKLTSLLTASLLTAGGLVGLAAQPANATSQVQTTFESGDNSYLLADYDGTTSSVVSLSSTSTASAVDGTHPGAPAGNVAKVIKGGYFWSSTGFSTLSGYEFVSAADKTVEMDIYTTNAVTVGLKLDAGSAYMQKNITSSGAGWEHVVFDFASPTSSVYGVSPYSESLNYSTAILSFAFDDADPADPNNQTSLYPGTYYFDNVKYNKTSACNISSSPTLVSWDTSDTSGAAPVTFGGAVAALKPAPSGSYVGNVKALKLIKPAGVETWAGVTVLNDACMNFAGATTVTANVYASEAAQLTLKLEGAANTQVDATLAAGWQTVTWTIGTVASQRSKVSFFSDLGSAGSSKVFYIDDIAFNAARSPAITGLGVQAAAVSYDVRLSASLKDTATDAYEVVNPCGSGSWCVNNKYFMKMIAAGSSTSLTYLVTVHGTSTPVQNASVKLRINTNNSGSNATWSSGGSTFGPVSSSSGSDAGFILGTTNSSGEVSFTFANTNSSGEAVRTLNNSNPYPAGCSSPAGQTKGAIEPLIDDVPGANIDTQYVDVLWPHISSSTINSAIAAGSDGVQPCPVAARPGTKVWSPAFDANNNGHYPHIRLEKSFLNEKLDGTWWDGVWQYRDADTRAYLKYIPAGSTFALTYTVTNEWGQPYEGAKVSLIVNANYSCSKTYFAYEGSLIGPDDCAGGGQTELPAKVANSKGQVTFVLTNTNTTGEAMPVDLNGAPNPASKELGTNIKPHVVGATQEGIDMLFAHFVSETGKAKAAGPGAKSATIGTAQQSEFVLTDESGNPITNTDVKYFVNGFDSKVGFAHTDYQGKVTIRSTNSSGQEGMQTVGVSLARDGKLPISGTATLNWVAPEFMIAATGNAGAVVVKVSGAAGKTVQITVAGKTYRRLAQTANAEFSIPAAAGKKAVKVVVSGKTLSKSVTVTK